MFKIEGPSKETLFSKINENFGNRKLNFQDPYDHNICDYATIRHCPLNLITGLKIFARGDISKFAVRSIQLFSNREKCDTREIKSDRFETKLFLTSGNQSKNTSVKFVLSTCKT